MKDFCLSDKIIKPAEKIETSYGKHAHLIETDDVKEFIKLLKEDCKIAWDKGNFVLANVQEAIDKLAGEKFP